MSEVTVTAANFKEEVINSDIPVLVDFWAAWCGPCRMMGAVLGEIDAEYEGRIKVCKINVDEEQDLAKAFNVTAIPKVVLIKDGKTIEESVGYRSKEDTETMLKQIIDLPIV